MPTLFIDSLPQGYSSQELRKLFSFHGYIEDAYVPLIQRHRVNGRFGFIEVQAWEQGERLIQEADGKEVGPMKIKVQWAKYPKRLCQAKRVGQFARKAEQTRNWMGGFIHKNMPNDGVWRAKQQSNRAVMKGEYVQKEKSARVIAVEAVQENLEWLARSLTCISDTPRDIDALRLMISKTFHEEIVVRDLGKFKFILTMESQEVKERLKNDGEERLKQWFSSVSDWAEDDVCQTRRLWLEIVGIPIQIWSEQNIRKIAENWGDVVLVEKESSKLESFAAAKVIIDTLSVNPIEDEAIIQVENKGFRVSVFETKTEYTIFHSGPLDEDNSVPSTIKDNVKIAGIDSNGDMEDQANIDHDHRQMGRSNGAVQSPREVDQTRNGSCSLNLNLNSNYTHQGGLPQGCPNNSINLVAEVACDDCLNTGKMEGTLGESSLIGIDAETERMVRQSEGRRRSIGDSSVSSSTKTRTRSAHLSENGFSVEMAKTSRPRLDQVETEQLDNIVADVNQCEPYHAPLESDGSTPPGFGRERITAPPGFEVIALPTVSPVRKIKATNERNGPAAVKRVTRSQVKKGRVQIRRSQANLDRIKSSSTTWPDKKGVDESLLDRQSVETTDSMIEIAEQALEIGKLLGVEVVSHKANAVKRITSSLKSNGGSRSRRPSQ